MYQKVSDGGSTFEHSGIMKMPPEAQPIREEISSEISSDISYEMPMSFIKCPRCESTSLISCKCWPTNYFCPDCEWGYATHSHEGKRQEEARDPLLFSYKGNVNQTSLISATVRK